MEWRKASKSGSTTNCVEVRRDLVAVRDSKCRQSVLLINKEAVAWLVSHVR